MSRSVRLVLVCVTLFVVLFPLAAGRPGQPPTLKADEPAYFLMTLSLIWDGDLRADVLDAQRLFDHFPYLPVENLILMSPDGWETTYFGKPYIYSLLAAPAVALFGVNGFFAFNLALLMAMVWMGATYLGRFNSGWLAALFSSSFFVLSPAFAYAFWIHPELFNMFSVAACLYLAFHRAERSEQATGLWGRLRRFTQSSTVRLLGSGAVLALGVYNKPMLAAAGVPALFLVFRRRGPKGAASWIAAGGVGILLIALGSVALTGKPSAYLGVDRGGVKVVDPQAYQDSIDEVRQFTDRHADEAANSWQWIFRLPEIRWQRLAEDVRYFFVGRHTGFVPYMPFAVLALVLFLLHGRRSAERWITLGAIAAVAVFFLVWIPFNWHGGGGFIGNRYFINVYPAFLFLVTAVSPAWITALGSTAAALLLGSVLFSPWGPPVWEPTLQAHVRGGLFRLFPLELSLRTRIPGYVHMGKGGVGFMGRRDQFQDRRADGVMWIQGAVATDVWIFSRRPLDRAMFQVRTLAPDNEVVLELPGFREVIPFAGAERPAEKRVVVELTPAEPSRTLMTEQGQRQLAYRMRVSTTAGRHTGNLLNARVKPAFYLGVELTYLGMRDQLERAEHYRVTWLDCAVPESLPAGESLAPTLRVRNDGTSTWPTEGAIPVHLSYHWLSAAGTVVDYNGVRTALALPVEPGGEALQEVLVESPAEPGNYTLSFDLVREHVAWFSARGATTCDARVEVTAAAADEAEESE